MFQDNASDDVIGVMRTIPSLAIVEFSPDWRSLRQAEMLAEGFSVLSRPVGPHKTACQYRTTRDVPLQPLHLADARLHTETDGRSAIRLRFECPEKVDWSQAGIDKVAIFLNAESPVSYALHLAMTRRVHAMYARHAGTYIERHQFDGWCKPMGFDDNDGLWKKADKVHIDNRSGLGIGSQIRLSQRATLGKTAKEACSRVLVSLETADPDEAEGWLPGGVLHTDLMVLLRVYLGYRSDARVRLTVPVRLLPEPRLSKGRRIQLGRTGLLGLKEGKLNTPRESLTVNLGCYEGLHYSVLQPAEDGHYRFD